MRFWNIQPLSKQGHGPKAILPSARPPDEAASTRSEVLEYWAEAEVVEPECYREAVRRAARNQHSPIAML